ncbi:MAG: hypothetical protein IKO42_02335 [Opitutales bacterium]|nr:hypothetical protein [Opitutales bacterium]
MKKFAALFLVLCIFNSAHARISPIGNPAEFGITEISSDDPLYVNPIALDGLEDKTFLEHLGVYAEHRTVLSVEYASNIVFDGMRTSNNTFAASLEDNGELFNGDGYTQLDAIIPFDNSFANIFRFLGGWKYNLTKDLHIDLGGTLVYATKRISGAGITGAGTRFTGDIYIGFIYDFILKPFVYYTYNFDYDSNKITFGFNPIFDLKCITGIENLSLVMEIYGGYVKANRWTADDEVNGRLPHNNYFFAQAEARLEYVLCEHWRFTVGGGYAHNDGAKDFDFLKNSPNNLLWINTSIGFIF